MDPASAPAQPKKRSLFSQKALSRKNKADLEEGLTFSRAKELEAERLAEEERQRQKRLNKIERKKSGEKVERTRSTDVTENAVDGETPPKKRRMSVDLNHGEGSAPDSSSTAETVMSPKKQSASNPLDHASASSKSPRSPSNSLTARYSRSLKPDATDRKPQAIHIIDDDSDSYDNKSSGNKYKKTISVDDDDDLVIVSEKPPDKAQPELIQSDDDEEFPELVQRARERERLRQEQAANASKAFLEKNHSQDSFSMLTTEPTIADPSIEILISSNLEGSIPLKVKRKMSQRLMEARLAWCDRQNIAQYSSDRLRSTIFLTWKRKRVYDSTTCAALGFKSNGSGEFLDDDEMTRGNIHLEAWTEEEFQKFEREEEAARKREEQGADYDEESPAPEEVSRFRLVLQAKDFESVKLFVKSNTVLEQLINAFKQKNASAEDKEISLYFDGEKLNPEDRVEDTELDDMDTVEIHIK